MIVFSSDCDRSYFAAIRPTYEPERSILTAPFIRGQHEFFVETVTNRFVP